MPRIGKLGPYSQNMYSCDLHIFFARIITQKLDAIYLGILNDGYRH